jgi:hypothetical protein
VTASVSTFSPKPHTPFQWAAQLDQDETQARQRCSGASSPPGIEFRWHDSRLSWLEGCSRAAIAGSPTYSRRRSAWARAYDGWSDRCRPELWEQALAAHGLDAAFYLRRRPLAEVLPWEHLDAGVSRKFLSAELARAVQGVLTPDCSIERCTYCGACDFKQVRNVDYHPEGAKGGLHHGARISRWAEMLVPDPEDAELPEWETRTWRRVRVSACGRPSASTRARRRSPTRRCRHRSPKASARRGSARANGNAEEWLGAVPSQLSPRGEAQRAVQRIRIRYRKGGPARFIGTREMSSVFARAAKRAGLPVAFSQGHHPLPRMAFGPALPVGCSSDDEYLDVDLVAAIPPAEVVAAWRGAARRVRAADRCRDRIEHHEHRCERRRVRLACRRVGARCAASAERLAEAVHTFATTAPCPCRRPSRVRSERSMPAPSCAG